MLGQVVFESPRMSLWFHTDERIVHHKMHQYPGQETLQTVLLQGLELLKHHRASRWLSDDRAGGALPKSHHDWGDQVWAPQAIAAGWRYWALLPPEQALGNANMGRLVEAYARRGVVVEIFSDPVKAFQWLRRQGDTALPTGQPQHQLSTMPDSGPRTMDGAESDGPLSSLGDRRG